jgi:hypothetical protein
VPGHEVDRPAHDAPEQEEVLHQHERRNVVQVQHRRQSPRAIAFRLRVLSRVVLTVVMAGVAMASKAVALCRAMPGSSVVRHVARGGCMAVPDMRSTVPCPMAHVAGTLADAVPDTVARAMAKAVPGTMTGAVARAVTSGSKNGEQHHRGANAKGYDKNQVPPLPPLGKIEHTSPPSKFPFIATWQSHDTTGKKSLATPFTALGRRLPLS